MCDVCDPGVTQKTVQLSSCDAGRVIFDDQLLLHDARGCRQHAGHASKGGINDPWAPSAASPRKGRTSSAPRIRSISAARAIHVPLTFSSRRSHAVRNG